MAGTGDLSKEYALGATTQVAECEAQTHWSMVHSDALHVGTFKLRNISV